MAVLARLRERAAAAPRRILLPEVEDPRVAEAATILAREGWARPVLLEADTAPTGVENLPPDVAIQDCEHGASACACRRAMEKELLFEQR